jgi:hypothetical protein
VVTSIKPSPLFDLNSTSGRPVTWISLRPFTLKESLSILKESFDRRPKSLRDIMTLCVSDVGGHPRGLEMLLKALDVFFESRGVDMTNILEVELLEFVVAEFAKFYNSHSNLSTEMMRMSLSGLPVGFNQMVGEFTVEELTAQGVFLDSERCIPQFGSRFAPTEDISPATLHHAIEGIRADWAHLW